MLSVSVCVGVFVCVFSPTFQRNCRVTLHFGTLVAVLYVLPLCKVYVNSRRFYGGYHLPRLV